MITNTQVSRAHRIGQTVLAVSALCTGMLAFAGTSFAAGSVVTVPPDPTGGQMDVAQTSVQTWVLTYGIPVLFGLLLLGVLIRLAVKWVRKATAKV